MPSLDKTFCMNRVCSHSDTCGRSIKRLDGKRAIVSMAGYKPDENGVCKHEEPYTEYAIPAWMERLCREHELEQLRRQELKDANSLDVD